MLLKEMELLLFCGMGFTGWMCQAIAFHPCTQHLRLLLFHLFINAVVY